MVNISEVGRIRQNKRSKKVVGQKGFREMGQYRDLGADNNIGIRLSGS